MAPVIVFLCQLQTKEKDGEKKRMGWLWEGCSPNKNETITALQLLHHPPTQLTNRSKRLIFIWSNWMITADVVVGVQFNLTDFHQTLSARPQVAVSKFPPTFSFDWFYIWFDLIHSTGFMFNLIWYFCWWIWYFGSMFCILVGNLCMIFLQISPFRILWHKLCPRAG